MFSKLKCLLKGLKTGALAGGSVAVASSFNGMDGKDIAQSVGAFIAAALFEMARNWMKQKGLRWGLFD